MGEQQSRLCGLHPWEIWSEYSLPNSLFCCCYRLLFWASGGPGCCLSSAWLAVEHVEEHYDRPWVQILPTAVSKCDDVAENVGCHLLVVWTGRAASLSLKTQGWSTSEMVSIERWRDETLICPHTGTELGTHRTLTELVYLRKALESGRGEAGICHFSSSPKHDWLIWVTDTTTWSKSRLKLSKTCPKSVNQCPRATANRTSDAG